jgi:hypothetical protein
VGCSSAVALSSTAAYQLDRSTDLPSPPGSLLGSGTSPRHPVRSHPPDLSHWEAHMRVGRQRVTLGKAPGEIGTGRGIRPWVSWDGLFF